MLEINETLVGEVQMMLSDLDGKTRRNFGQFIAGFKHGKSELYFRGKEKIKCEHLLGWHARCDSEWDSLPYEDKLVNLLYLIYSPAPLHHHLLITDDYK